MLHSVSTALCTNLLCVVVLADYGLWLHGLQQLCPNPLRPQAKDQTPSVATVFHKSRPPSPDNAHPSVIQAFSFLSHLEKFTSTTQERPLT